jgi:hypothetical protein
VGIQIDRLPPFRYSLDAPGHLLPTRQVLNKIIRDDIYRQFIQITWVNPPGGLRPKMAFYAEHFLGLRDGFIVRPHYTLCHWAHALRIPLGQFRVGSHRLRVETDHQIDRPDRICQLCQLQEVETEEHFIFRCPIYYEIRGWFHCLFKGAQTLTGFFSYPDQRCLALYIQEALRFEPILFSLLRDQTLFDGSPPSSQCYLLVGALRDKPTPTQLQTPDQCGPVGPSSVPRDFSDMTRPDPFPGDDEIPQASSGYYLFQSATQWTIQASHQFPLWTSYYTQFSSLDLGW